MGQNPKITPGTENTGRNNFFNTFILLSCCNYDIILKLSNMVAEAQHNYDYIYCRVATAEKILIIRIPPSTIKRYTLFSLIKVQRDGNGYTFRDMVKENT